MKPWAPVLSWKGSREQGMTCITTCNTRRVRARLPGRMSIKDLTPDPTLPVAIRLADLAELTKPGITLMVVLTTGLGFLLAEREGISFLLLVHTLIGTGLVSAG